MGLLDSIMGALGGGRGQAQHGGGGTSPVVKALLLLLAAKAAQSYGSGRTQASGGTAAPGGLPGGLGGLVSGGLAGGLGSLLEQFRAGGLGGHVDSWLSPGQNRRLMPEEMERALGPDAIDELQTRTGLSRDDILSQLSHEVPEAIDQLSPAGRLPVEDELAAMFDRPRP